ncbi:hypothetical protein N9T15_00695 [Pelagibacteraceae bacterium]|nr:hypothetical protein [Pelagibacteraceae bacterium]
MSNIVLKNLKDKLEDLYKQNFAVQVGIYDNEDNLSYEKVIPLGNYIYNPKPSNHERKITENLCSRSLK